MFIVGAPKAATTTLHRLIDRDDRVAMSSEKEPCFYSDPAKYARGMGWYEGLFKVGSTTRVLGESSTTYARAPWREEPWTQCPWPLINRDFPDARLVYLIRNPVERAFSQYRHRMRHGCDRSFEQAIEDWPSLLDASRYATQYREMREHFSSEQILVLAYDQLSDDMGGTLGRVYDHLGLESVDLELAGAVRDNAAGAHYAVSRRLKRFRLVKAMRSILPRSVKESAVRLAMVTPWGRAVEAGIRVPAMADSTQTALLAEFQRDIEWARDHTGLALEFWGS